MLFRSSSTTYDEAQVKELIAHHIKSKATGYTVADIVSEVPATLGVNGQAFVYKLTTNLIDEATGKTYSSISVKRYKTKTYADQTVVADDNFFVADMTVGLYGWDNLNKGLTCYYRINIFDKAYDANKPMRYSVMRNNSYKVNINEVTSIGFPKAEDVEYTPDTPLIETTTFMQVEITINKWTVVDMDTSIGM